ncbi:MAG: hypothetical protein A2Y38_16455 [Spirochaetes bacterium GWB1_59_5]|nr:MAG: hypothetical protein A2Y38_16455 [Spirochaetes bacterium GWB1_59_5]
MAGLLPISIDYSDKDYDSIRARIEEIIRAVFPNWTDFNVASFGNILIQLYAFVGDVLLYYQDTQARESRIVSATQRKNLLALVKLIGFKPAGPRPAVVDERFTLSALSVNNVIIPAGTKVSNQDPTPIDFYLVLPLTILAGTLSGVGSCENAKIQNETFSSIGRANQEITLSFIPFVDNSLILSAGNGAYTEVETFVNSKSVDRHFIVRVDHNDKARVIFGNGVNGTLPTGSITVTYKTGGGTLGNVAPNTVKSLTGSFVDVLNNPVTLSVTNPTKGSNGTNRQSAAQIRDLAPLSLTTLTRSITKNDYETNAIKLATVVRALMLTSDEDSSIPENTGILYIVPQGGGAPSVLLKSQVLTQVTVTFPGPLTFKVSIADPILKVIDVQATIAIRQGAVPSVVAQRVRDALTAFFSPTLVDGTVNRQIDFGANILDVDGNVVSEIAFSDVQNVVRDTVGVRKISPGEFFLNLLEEDVLLAPKEFPSLGTVVLIDADTGLNL